MHYVVILKLQSVSFASLSPSMFENLELQLLAEFSCLRGWYSGMAPAQCCQLSDFVDRFSDFSEPLATFFQKSD